MADFVGIEAALLAGMLLSLAAGTVVHEFGHALAATAVGLPPRLISIGSGPILARLRLGRAWLVVRATLVGGYMHAVIGPDTTAWQHAVTIAAGPAATLLMLALAAGVAALTPPPPARLFLIGWIIGQVIILASSAIPYERKLKTHVSVSDGMKLVLLARGQNRGAFNRLHTALLRHHLAEGATAPAPSRHFPEIIFQRSRRDRKTDAWAQDEVAESMRGLLAQDDLPDAERALAAELLRLSELHQHVRRTKAKRAALRRGASTD